WDVQWGQQSWTADDSDLGRGYNYSYRAIGRANDFLSGLEDEHNTEVKKFPAYNTMDGEAHALRAYFYMFLAQNWGRVPMLATGESFLNTPNKAAAETDDEMWDFIIDDLKTAVRQLDWKPYNGEYGRCTKGMALSYLGEAYL
ncbi:RagB/SusD family nutrient uptake outer membrane protein, partial [Segatella buccae]